MTIDRQQISNLLFMLFVLTVAIKLGEALLIYRPVLNLSYILTMPVIGFCAFLIAGFRDRGHFESEAQMHDKRLLLFLFLFMSLGLSVLLLQSLFLLETTDITGHSPLDLGRNALFVNLSWMLVGVAIARSEIRRSNFFSASLVLYILLIVGLNWSPATGALNYVAISRKMGVDNMTHLILDDYALVLSFLAYALSSKSMRVFVLLGIMVTQYAIGGRGAFLLGSSSIVLYELLRSRLDHELYLRYLLYTFVFIALAAILFAMTDTSGRAFTHMFYFLSSTPDSSWQARSWFLSESLSQLWSQAWFGDPTWIVEHFGGIGAYIHNGISIWQFYGLPFFLVFVSAIALSLSKARGVLKQPHNSCFEEFKVILLIYCVAGVILSKALLFTPIWLAIGLWLGAPQVYREQQDAIDPEFSRDSYLSHS